MERARSGDGAAFAALVSPQEEIAFRTAYLIARNAADAEDAVQTGLVKAWRALPRFRAGRAAAPVAARDRGERGAQPATRRPDGGRGSRCARRHEVPSGGAAPSPEGSLLAAEERVELLAALERLREEDREVLSCRYLLDLSEEETAEVLSIRRGTVKSRTSRALERLRAELGGAA